jgi:hypothetical protein
MERFAVRFAGRSFAIALFFNGRLALALFLRQVTSVSPFRLDARIQFQSCDKKATGRTLTRIVTTNPFQIGSE